jgi:glycosidase
MNYPLGSAIVGFVGGRHLDRTVIDEHHTLTHSLRALDAREFATRVLELGASYDRDVVAVQLNILGSHDTPRLRTLLGGDADRVRLATLLQATLPGAPCIYYGDEIGLRGGNDPDCRGAFPWDEGRWEPGLRASVRAMLRLRAAEPALRDGPVRMVGAEGGAVAFERGHGASRFVVAVNADDAAVRLDVRIEDAPPGAGGHLVPIELSGLGGVTEAAIVDGNAAIGLAPRSGAVMRVV